MAEGLEGILQQLHSVLTQLNTVLKTEGRPTKDIENDVRNDAKADANRSISPEDSSKQLYEWLQSRILTPERLYEMKKGLVSFLRGDVRTAVDSSGGAVSFKGYCHIDATIQLRTKSIGIRTLVNMPDAEKQFLLKEVEENWPASLEPWMFIRFRSPGINSTDYSLRGMLYDSDSLGYPSSYGFESGGDRDAAPGRI
ncbi:hypothetical protein K449DRAFT_203137 [Hypoxylon sp. EC38]|nr:hypothetical protein K449DRAFT_203137 [Hypoxylon sp. EC38]